MNTLKVGFDYYVRSFLVKFIGIQTVVLVPIDLGVMEMVPWWCGVVCGGGDRRRLGREVKEKGKWGKDKQR